MTTIPHTRGSTVGDPLVLTDNGQPLNLTGCTVTAHVEVGATCRDLVTRIVDPLLGEAWPDWETLGLAPHAYRVTVTVTWPDGAVEPAENTFTLHVKGAC